MAPEERVQILRELPRRAGLLYPVTNRKLSPAAPRTRKWSLSRNRTGRETRFSL